MRFFPDCFGNEGRLSVFIHYYYRKCKFILSSRQVRPLGSMDPDTPHPPEGEIPKNSSEPDRDWEDFLRASARLLPSQDIKSAENIDWDFEVFRLTQRMMKAMKERRLPQNGPATEVNAETRK
mmetsp:Transcript_23243/g.49506  ORF Transcript_23243/g.49506 Transcript_23243/m.49506 type:complete len:123 (+) Transcript_23243:2-370(+)